VLTFVLIVCHDCTGVVCNGWLSYRATMSSSPVTKLRLKQTKTPQHKNPEKPKLYKTNICFSKPTRERGRHDVVIRLRRHKSILQLVSAVSWTIELSGTVAYMGKADREKEEKIPSRSSTSDSRIMQLMVFPSWWCVDCPSIHQLDYHTTSGSQDK